ncbi:MAG: SLBB domain-containing protein [Gemmatimonadaceae bacterium]|nr:SLBB domain-containing protein [Gemmatimonadaceae bacterium]
MRLSAISWALVVSAFAGGASPSLLRAQAPVPEGHESRTALTAELESYNAFANSSAYSQRTRAAARLTAEQLRSRLERGDFKPGDRFSVRVSGAVSFVDTITVLAGPSAQIGTFGELSLHGVLRSEIEGAVRGRVAETVRDANVTVRVLMRIAVFGAVASPGYRAVPLETRLDELLMSAGGPSPDADPMQIRVVRGGAVLMDGDRVMTAIAAGETVGSLGLVEGDLVSVEPREAPWNRAATLQLVTVFATPVVTFFLLR